VQAVERTEESYATQGERSWIPPSLWAPALDSGARRGFDLEYAF